MARTTWKQTTDHVISARHLHATEAKRRKLKPMYTGNVTTVFLLYSYNCSNCVYASGTLIQQASSGGKNRTGVTFSYRYVTSSSDGKSQLFTACSYQKKKRERWHFVFFRPNRILSASNLLIPGCWEKTFLFGNLLRKREDEAGISPGIKGG